MAPLGGKSRQIASFHIMTDRRSWRTVDTGSTVAGPGKGREQSMVDEAKVKGDGFRLSSLKVDTAKSEEGVWFPFGEDFEVKVARIGNPKYQSYITKMSKPHVRSIRRQGIASEMLKKIQRQATAKFLLLDWRGLHDDNGEEIPYSEAKALEILSNPQYPEFYDIVLECAQDNEMFRSEDEADAEKN
jgi:hypothetical protein